MLQTINLTANRGFKIRNFEEDKIATLNNNRGLRYEGRHKGYYVFEGNFFLKTEEGELIESFEIRILIGKNYPYAFPNVVLLDNKFDKNENYHINEDSTVCFEHSYVINALTQKGLRLFDFANYFLPKYFSWALVKKYGNSEKLQEWAHQIEGTKQLYEILLETTDKSVICLFLENYCKASKINRNHKCYCGNGKKIKHCHIEAAEYLKATPKKVISSDINLFKV